MIFVLFENSQGMQFNKSYIETVLPKDRLKEYGAGGFKQLGQVLMFDTKTDGSVPRRVSLTN